MRWRKMIGGIYLLSPDGRVGFITPLPPSWLFSGTPQGWSLIVSGVSGREVLRRVFSHRREAKRAAEVLVQAPLR